MRVTVEKCEGGFLLEVFLDRRDPTFLVLHSVEDYKKVVTCWAEVEQHLRDLFMGKNFDPSLLQVPVIVDHGKKNDG